VNADFPEQFLDIFIQNSCIQRVTDNGHGEYGNDEERNIVTYQLNHIV